MSAELTVVKRQPRRATALAHRAVRVPDGDGAAVAGAGGRCDLRIAASVQRDAEARHLLVAEDAHASELQERLDAGRHGPRVRQHDVHRDPGAVPDPRLLERDGVRRQPLQLALQRDAAAGLHRRQPAAAAGDLPAAVPDVQGHAVARLPQRHQHRQPARARRSRSSSSTSRSRPASARSCSATT